MKVLVICSGGVVRSVGMAHILRHDYGHDAIPIGHDANSQETIDKLSGWADRIIVMQPHFAKGILKIHVKKIVDPTLTDIGPDVWANPLHSEVQAFAHKVARDLTEKGILSRPGEA